MMVNLRYRPLGFPILILTTSLAMAGVTAPAKSGADELRLGETEATITIRHGESVLLSYHKQPPPAPRGVDPVYRRSGFIHPVRSPGGATVTAMFPADHLHQHGIFSAWVRTRYGQHDVDFWNLRGDTGRVVHDQLVATFSEGDRVGFEVSLIHRALQPLQDVLRETWRVTARLTDSSYFCFDIEAHQQALTDTPLVVQQYHYGGMAVRGPTAWLLKANGDGDASNVMPEIINDSGSDRLAGNAQPARWVAMTGPGVAGQASLAVLCHQDNFRAPQPARLHPSKPYFCFAPCIDGQFVIDSEHSYRAHYRYLVFDGPPEPRWLDQQWHSWIDGDQP